MTTFWTMPCRKSSFGYRNGWMKAKGEHWRTMKERPGCYRRVTKWFVGHPKKLRPNPNKKRDEKRWRLMGYEDRNHRPIP